MSKVRANIKIKCDSGSVKNKKFLITKIKSYRDEVTNFHHKEIPMAEYNYTCLNRINLDSALKKRWKRLLSSAFKIV